MSEKEPKHRMRRAERRNALREQLIAEHLERKRKEKEAYLEHIQEKAMKPYTNHK